MYSDRNTGSARTDSIFANGEVEHAIREGRRLRAEAVRNAFSKLRPALGSNG
ncbi:MAG: hypothetical protein ACFE0S_08355 [Rhodospirillales bacterium]